MTGTSIIGWSHLPFGKHADKDIESMMVDAGADALKHAGVAPKDVDAIFVGHFNAGFSAQDFPVLAQLRHRSRAALQAGDAGRERLRHRLRRRAPGHQGDRRQAGAHRAGGRRREDDRQDGAAIGRNLLKASYVKEEADTPGGFAGVFGRIAELYFQRYGDQSDALARIAAKNHRNGVDNPYAQMRKDLGYDFCRNVSDKNPLVAGPLQRTDCSLVSDGAAALVLADLDTALALGRAVRSAASRTSTTSCRMRARDIVQFEGCAHAWRKALAARQAHARRSRLRRDARLLHHRRAARVRGDGPGRRARAPAPPRKAGPRRTAACPINRSGGLKAKGHPIGATGVSMHVLTAMQLTGEAGAMQLKNPKLGGVFNMGGAAVANYVSILEPLR